MDILLTVFIKLFFYYNNSLTTLLLLILPHGIFEIPAIIIAGAAGFKIPYEIIRYLAGKKEQILTKEDIKDIPNNGSDFDNSGNNSSICRSIRNAGNCGDISI